MSNTPESIFQLGQTIPEVRQFIDLWEHGRLDWNTCLLEMHKALVKRCFELNETWQLGLEVSEKMFAISEIERPKTFAQAALFDYCKLQQQECVIRAIHVIANVHYHLLDAAKLKVQNRQIARIMCYKDGRTEIEYNDGRKEAGFDIPNLKLHFSANECRDSQ